jgi:transcriptional regulator with XRE-family HTH domain
VYETFGAYVRNQRKLARLTLRQAAGMARISNPYLSQIEHGLALPSVTVLRALADALEVSTASLLLRAAGVVSDPPRRPTRRRAEARAAGGPRIVRRDAHRPASGVQHRRSNEPGTLRGQRGCIRTIRTHRTTSNTPSATAEGDPTRQRGREP